MGSAVSAVAGLLVSGSVRWPDCCAPRIALRRGICRSGLLSSAEVLATAVGPVSTLSAIQTLWFGSDLVCGSPTNNAINRMNTISTHSIDSIASIGSIDSLIPLIRFITFHPFLIGLGFECIDRTEEQNY